MRSCNTMGEVIIVKCHQFEDNMCRIAKGVSAERGDVLKSTAGVELMTNCNYKILD